jgi:hypothetical protein
LAFQVLKHLADFVIAGVLHDQRRGAEYFRLQRRVGEKIRGVGDEQVGLALVRGFATQAGCHGLRMFGQ